MNDDMGCKNTKTARKKTIEVKPTDIKVVE